MKVLALFLITFTAISSFAQIVYQKDSSLPLRVQAAIDKDISYNCPNLAKDNKIYEESTKIDEIGERFVRYSTKLSFQVYSSDGEQQMASMSVHTETYGNGEISIQYTSSPSYLCHSIDN